MKTPFTRVLAVIISLLALRESAQAQYIFKSAPDASVGSGGLAPYQQNFDGLSGTNAVFTNNQTLRGVYASFTLDGTGSTEYPSSIRTTHNPTTGAVTGVYYDWPIPPDNGSQGSAVDAANMPSGAGWYHFGSTTVNVTDRALGGIAATNTDNGVGYIGIRLQNSSGTLIKNLEISYAMEQWYNSGKLDQARVKVAYRKLGASASAASREALVSGTWTDIAELQVDAPSTATVIANRDGNSPANRRVLRTKLIGGTTPASPFGAGLANGEEIMIRWSYVFNSATNGNGLSLDDVTITPETNIFYSQTSGNLNNKNTWGINSDGSGTKPADFTPSNTTFYVRGTTPLASRLPNGGQWAVSGANSKLVVGTATEAATLYLGSADNVAATVDVASGSTLQIEKPVSGITLGSLGSTSVVEYINDVSGTTQTVNGGSYGQLKLTGVGPKSLSGAVIVSNAVAFSSTALSSLALKDYDFTILKEGSVAVLSGAAAFVTDGKGGLRQTVPSTGVEVSFPVAVTADVADYTPVVLSQTAANSEDTYKVRVINNVYRSYDANEVGTTAVTQGVVNKTWFISEEVPGSSDITLQTFWNTKDEAAGFDAAASYVDHYTTGGTWDGLREFVGATTKNNLKVVQKRGVKKFSPFGVTSQTGGVLPVKLLRFEARRSGAGVQCSWATAAESGNSHFLVERSTDATTFQALGTVAGAGTSLATHPYAFLDSHALPGPAYYRLRQVDQDGTEAFSPVVVVQGTAKGGSVTITPNPGAGRFELWTNFNEATQLRGRVLNTLGQTVRTFDQAAAAGAARTPLDLSAQQAGLYIVQLATPEGVVSLRVVKQ